VDRHSIKRITQTVKKLVDEQELTRKAVPLPLPPTLPTEAVAPPIPLPVEANAPSMPRPPAPPQPDVRLQAHETTHHKIQAGETLSQIAERYGRSVAEVQAANRLTDKHHIEAGRSLLIPVRTPSEPRKYRVQAGDTLSEIALSQGVTLQQLKAANPQIRNVDLIYAGQSLQIPDSHQHGLWQNVLQEDGASLDTLQQSGPKLRQQAEQLFQLKSSPVENDLLRNLTYTDRQTQQQAHWDQDRVASGVYEGQVVGGPLQTLNVRVGGKLKDGLNEHTADNTVLAAGNSIVSDDIRPGNNNVVQRWRESANSVVEQAPLAKAA